MRRTLSSCTLLLAIGLAACDAPITRPPALAATAASAPIMELRLDSKTISPQEFGALDDDRVDHLVVERHNVSSARITAHTGAVRQGRTRVLVDGLEATAQILDALLPSEMVRAEFASLPVTTLEPNVVRVLHITTTRAGRW